MNVSFVAKVSSNYHADLERCLRLIDKAAEIGCNAVKFEAFNISKLFSQEILERSPKHRAKAHLELPGEFVPHLANRCHKLGLQFSCAPSYLEAVDLLFPYVDFFMVSSFELRWDALLKACARTGKRVVLTTGMATLEEVVHAVSIVRRNGCANPILLHCVSGYPVPVEECNLAAIDSLRDNSQCGVGWSDHSANPGVIFRAVHRWRASMVEFHLDLDGKGDEFTSGHYWLPSQIKPVIDTIKTGFIADGTGDKRPAPREENDRDWRADPEDGLRPMQHIRKEWRSKE